ncbi:hypothetical protein E2C01_064955 [Portunus trituberculatus]|uniref:Uncharacterized protein n=1 Tax=Portunus trituberculatus TaxID=210409 RepID=A0A5B7HD76_PORTR|nr:hypothetical protein [Portunus trituberculatus]
MITGDPHDAKIQSLLTLSVLRRIFTTSLGYDYSILFALGRVYGGQKINGHSLHYLNPLPHEFLKLYKIRTVSRMNMETCHGAEGIKVKKKKQKTRHIITRTIKTILKNPSTFHKNLLKIKET